MSLRKSLVAKRSVVIGGHKTSISLEDVFWQQIKNAAAEDNMPVAGLIKQIDHGRGHRNLSSACRIFVLERALYKAAN